MRTSTVLRWSAMRRLAAMIVALVTLGSCKPAPRQILVRIETDIPQGAMGTLRAMRVQLKHPTTADDFYDRVFPLDGTGGGFRLPGDVAVTLSSEMGGTILDTRVTAMRGQVMDQDELFTVRAVATFPREDAVTLWVYLANRCLILENQQCPPGYTCGRYGCEQEVRGPLPSSRMDAGAPETSVVPPRDSGSMDASATDASAMDASDAGPCAPGRSLCSATCVDPQSDPNHCGVCGRRCSDLSGVDGSSCVAGECRLLSCQPGLANCDTQDANGCETDLMSVTDCNRCRVRCEGATPLCGGARGCVSSCMSGEAMCGSICANVQSSVLHCGMCGRECAEFANGTRACMAGRCTGTCSAGFADCDGAAANGCEVALGTDVNHCGACRNACTAGANAAPQCRAGRCEIVCDPGFEDCDGNAANGCEADLRNSNDHCGRCTQRCVGAANQSAMCAMGSCSIACRPGFADCDMNAANGCEASLSSPATCGSCTNNCGARMCSAGMCTMSCSGATPTNCAGSCVDTQSNPSHCGACGAACPVRPNSTPTCGGGRCSFACNPGWSDCNGDPLDGCETRIENNVLACGSCATACSDFANTQPSCSGGMCSYACTAGFGDCNRMQPDGCEENFSTSVAHCGRCGNECGPYANATPVCSAGACSLVCNAGFENADGILSNGCERATCPMEGTVCMMTACRVFRLVCAGDGTSTCSAAEPINEGVTCNMNARCVSGECVSFGDGGASCMDAGAFCRPFGNVCQVGSIVCMGPLPTCVFSAHEPAGTDCTPAGGPPSQCNGFGGCLPSGFGDAGIIGDSGGMVQMDGGA